MKFFLIFAILVTMIFAPTDIEASFHFWDINEIYSNADGKRQFVELVTSSDGQQFLIGHTISANSDGVIKIYTWTDNSPSPTSNTKILLATASLAATPGFPTPNFIIPDNFIVPTAETIIINFGESSDVVIINGGLPIDGLNSVNDGGTAQIATPTNYAGETATPPFGVAQCSPPDSGIWTVTFSCTLDSSSTAPENVIIQGNSVLIIPNGLSLNIDFENFNLTIESGSGVKIESGGKIMSAVLPNVTPTINAIANKDAISGTLRSVSFSGVTAGGESQTISVSALSDNNSLTGIPSVTYTSPNTMGTVQFTPPAGRTTSDTATITVTVTDDGGTANGGDDSTSIMFDVTVGPDSPFVISVAQDNTIFEENPNNSAGACSDFFVGRAGGPNFPTTTIRRALLQFEQSAINELPPTAMITSVTVSLNLDRTTDSMPRTIFFHELTNSWGEGTVTIFPCGVGAAAQTGDATWLHRLFSISTWTTAGGDFDSTASTSFNVGTALGLYTTTSNAGMIADVSGWQSNPSSNNGWLLKMSTSDELVDQSARSFDSRTGTTPPTLTIQYSVP